MAAPQANVSPALKKPKRSEDEQGVETMQLVPAVDVGGFSIDLVKVYYGRRLFPFSDMYKWLAYGNDRKLPGADGAFFGHREFSFTLADDVYVRYQSFADAAEMEAAIREKCPHKIDIGAIYNVNPAKRTAYQGATSDRVFAPVERELVFDVDMTDYDDVRSCCTGASVCSTCWPLMTIAIKVVDRALRDDFGFEHLLWVFSGRRGVHCWVCDRRARRLTSEQRSAVAEYFRVYKGSENNSRKVALVGAALHPALSRAYDDVLLPFFTNSVLPGQALLATESDCEKVLEMVPDEDVRAIVRERWRSLRVSSAENLSVVRWRELEKTVKGNRNKNPGLRRCLEEIQFTYTYPRLDLEVSKHMNHLLKAPFCVHPKTGKVCVPIDPEHCDSFDPNTVPTVQQLLHELNTFTGEMMPSADDDDLGDLGKTSMRQAVELFRKSFLHPLLDACQKEMQLAHLEKLGEKKSIPTLAW